MEKRPKKFSTSVIEKVYKDLQLNGSFDAFIEAMILEEKELHRKKNTK